MTRTEHAPGIYFGMSMAEYRADPALSFSGIKDMLISPLTYWAKNLDPDREDDSSADQDFGTAFHARLLEGPQGFAAKVAVLPDDFNGRTNEGKALKKAMLESGKVVLKPEQAAEIERQAGMVLSHPSASRACQGGMAEVSVFWIDDETGVRMKSRFDYLKVNAVVDFKTFSNSQGMTIEKAIARAVANYGYHIQAVTYLEAVQHAKAFALNPVDGVSSEWLNAFSAAVDPSFVFVFIEKASWPNIRVREFKRISQATGQESLSWQSGHTAMRQAIELYQISTEKFGLDRPWQFDEPMLPFSDHDFPMWMME